MSAVHATLVIGTMEIVLAHHAIRTVQSAQEVSQLIASDAMLMPKLTYKMILLVI